MPFHAHQNFAYSLVATAPSPATSGTVLTVSAGEGANFPATPFPATVWPAGELPLNTNAEIVLVTDVTGDDLTIQRAYESTSAQAIAIGYQIAATITAGDITAIENAIPSTAGLISAINVSAGATSNNLSKVTFSNGNGVSFGLSGSTLTATVATNYQSQGAYLTTAALSQDSSKYAGVGESVGTVAGTDLGLTVNTDGVSILYPKWITTSAAQTNQTVGLYASSNTNLTSSGTQDARSLSFRAVGPLSIGYSAGELVFSNVAQSAGAYLTTAALSGDTSKYVQAWELTGNTAGTTSSAQGTKLYFSGGNSLTVSGNSNTMVFSVGAYLTTARASTDAIGLNTAKTNVTWTVNSSGLSLDAGGYAGIVSGATNCSVTVNTSGVSVNLPAYISTQSTQFLALTLGGNTAGTTTFNASNNASLFFNGGNNITLSGNGSTVTISAAGQTNQSAIKAFGVSNTGATAGNTGVSTGIDWVMAGSNLITLSQSTAVGGPNTVWVQHPAWLTTQTNQTLGLYAVGSTVGQSSSSTFDARTMSFNGTGDVSVGFSSGSIVISGSTYSTVGTATTVKGVASANSVGSATRWAAEDHAHAGVAAIGISSAGNSAGTSGSQVGTYWLQGGTGITLSQITSNNGSHTLVVSAGGGTLAMWPDILPGSTAVSTYYSGSTSQGAGGASTQTGYTFSLYAVPMALQAAVAFSEARFGVSNTRSGASTGSVTQMISFGIYSNNASTLSLVKGYYGGLIFSQNSITAHTFSLFTVTTGNQQSGAGGGFSGIVNAAGSIYSSAGNISSNSQLDNTNAPVKWMRVDNGVATTLTAGQYYAVLGFFSASSGGNIFSNVGILQSNALSSLAIADLGRENSTQTSNYLPAWGAISTTFTSISNAATWFPLPAAINMANMSLSSSAWQRFHFPFLRNNS